MTLDIIMAVYNTRPDYLLEAVYSIIDQEHKDWKFIILDDGSTAPATLNALKLLPDLDDRIELYRLPHAGLPVALNFGLELADTPFVARMDADDVSHPSRLARQVEYLEQHPEVDVLGTALFGFYEKDIGRKPAFTITKDNEVVYAKGDESFYICHATSVYRLQKAIDIGGYKPSLLRKQDIDFFIRMQNAGAIMHNLPEVLYAWRRYRE